MVFAIRSSQTDSPCSTSHVARRRSKEADSTRALSRPRDREAPRWPLSTTSGSPSLLGRVGQSRASARRYLDAIPRALDDDAVVLRERGSSRRRTERPRSGERVARRAVVRAPWSRPGRRTASRVRQRPPRRRRRSSSKSSTSTSSNNDDSPPTLMVNGRRGRVVARGRGGEVLAHPAHSSA